MKQKKLMALGMAAMLALSSSVAAFAADSTTDPSTGTINGTGNIEGFVDKDVYTVTLPTTSSVNFKLDPQELLLATSSSAKLDNSDLSAGYGSKILFESGDNYTSKSADITVVNKSTFDVDVKVDVNVTGLTKDGDDGYAIEIMDPTAEGFSFGDKTAITLALIPSTNTLTGTTEGSAVAGTAVNVAADGKATSTQKVAVSSDIDDAYEVTTSAGDYSYSIKSELSAVAFNEVIFNLSGTVNTNADWTNFSKDDSSALAVAVTYNITKHVENAAPTFTTGSSIGVINYTKGTGNNGLKSITSITMVYNGKVVDGFNAKTDKWDAATVTDSTITFDSAYTTYYSANETTVATVTYVNNLDETKTATVTVKTAEAAD